MRKRANYVNHLGEVADLCGGGIYFDNGKLADWEWDTHTLNGKTAMLTRRRRTMPLSLLIATRDEKDGLALRDRLFELMEKDCIATKPGRLYVGDWYIRCFVTASEKSMYWYTGELARYDLTLTVDNPLWTKEHTNSYKKQAASADGSGVDFSYDFTFDFGCSSTFEPIENPGFDEAPARITVYGPAENPRITINGNHYEVSASVPTGGLLVIDGLDKTITLKASNGAETNAFHLRRGDQWKDSGSYVFQPIKPGDSTVTWDGSFGFDVTLYEQRGERRWGA